MKFINKYINGGNFNKVHKIIYIMGIESVNFPIINKFLHKANCYLIEKFLNKIDVQISIEWKHGKEVINWKKKKTVIRKISYLIGAEVSISTLQCDWSFKLCLCVETSI